MARYKRIKPEQLADAITEIIDDYTKEVGEGVPEDVKSTGKACVQILRAHIDSAGIGGNKYRNSFTSTTTLENRFQATVEVWSPAHYRLAHLLEHGHRVVVNGKTIGNTKAYPHFAPAEKEASELLEKKILMRVRGEGVATGAGHWRDW